MKAENPAKNTECCGVDQWETVTLSTMSGLRRGVEGKCLRKNYENMGGMKRLIIRRKALFSAERGWITGGLTGRVKKWCFLLGAEQFVLHVRVKQDRGMNGQLDGQADESSENTNLCTNW